jgi:hypothetical protein
VVLSDEDIAVTAAKFTTYGVQDKAEAAQ